MSSTSLLIDKPMFGLTDLRADDLWKEELQPLINKNNVTEFKKKIEDLDYNMKHLSKHLLELLYSQLFSPNKESTLSNEAKLDLAEFILNLELEQEEILHCLYRCLADFNGDFDILSKFCRKHKNLLQFNVERHFRAGFSDISRESGYPLLCVTRTYAFKRNSPKNPVETFQKRFDLLIELGADINARYRDEITVIHFAAQEECWEIVEILLKNYRPNIDIEINTTTAREIIREHSPELEENYSIQEPNSLTINDLLFNALYEKNEDQFLELLDNRDNPDKNENAHDGRYTLLQLAIKNKFERGTGALLRKGANINSVSGCCTLPVLLVLNNPNYEGINWISRNKEKINFIFSCKGGTFLNSLAIKCGRKQDVHNKKNDFYVLIKEALSKKIHLLAKDAKGFTALEYLGSKADKNKSTLINIFFDLGGFVTVSENFVSNTQPEIFTNYFDEKIRYVHGLKDVPTESSYIKTSERIDASYGFLEPNKTNENVSEMLPFYKISKSKEHQSVLLHPLVTLFLLYKWRKIAIVYMLNVLFYILFTLFYSWYVYDLTENSFFVNETCNENGTIYKSVISNSNEVNVIVYGISIFFYCLIFLRELFQFLISGCKYIRNFENWIEMFLLAFSLLSFLPTVSEIKMFPAIAITLTYIELTLLISRNPYFGTYITMFRRVSVKSLKILLIFSSFLFAFAFGFYVLFNNVNDQNLFQNLWFAVIKTSAMAAGEPNIDSIKFEYSPLVSEIMFLVFLFIVPIVFMNLLNALAVSDTQKVIDRASLVCCISNIKFYTKIESMWMESIYENSGKGCCSTITNKIKKFSLKLIPNFKTTILPLPEMTTSFGNKTTNCLAIYVDQNKKFYPHVYAWYTNPDQPVYHGSIFKHLEYFFYRVLLQSNEDKVVKEFYVLKKYPPVTYDVNECLENFTKRFNDMGLKTENSIVTNMENFKTLQLQALANAEEKLKSEITLENTTNMDTIMQHINLKVQHIEEQLDSKLNDMQSKMEQYNDEHKFEITQIKDMLQSILDRI